MKNQPPINVIQFSSQALENINSLIRKQLNFNNDDIEKESDLEIILGISKSGKLTVFDGNPNRRYLVTDNCTKKHFELVPSDSSDEFAIRNYKPVNKGDKIINDLTFEKKVKSVKPLGITLYTESGCACDDFGCVHWS